MIAGLLYHGSLVYALGSGVRRRWITWSGFVGTAVGIFVYMAFESHFLGGLSVSSVVLELFIGLLPLSDHEEYGEELPPTMARYVLVTSRAARALDEFRRPSEAESDHQQR